MKKPAIWLWACLALALPAKAEILIYRAFETVWISGDGTRLPLGITGYLALDWNTNSASPEGAASYIGSFQTGGRKFYFMQEFDVNNPNPAGDPLNSREVTLFKWPNRPDLDYKSTYLQFSLSRFKFLAPEFATGVNYTLNIGASQLIKFPYVLTGSTRALLTDAGENWYSMSGFTYYIWMIWDTLGANESGTSSIEFILDQESQLQSQGYQLMPPTADIAADFLDLVR